MQIIKTVIWVLFIVALAGFSYINWEPVEVEIWQNLFLETKIPMLVVVSFFVGFVPMWLINRAQSWHSTRKITSLESAARTAANTPIAPREVDEEEVAAADEAAEQEEAAQEMEDQAIEEASEALSPDNDTPPSIVPPQ